MSSKAIKKLTDEEAQARLEWLMGPACVKLADRCYGTTAQMINTEMLDPLPPEAIELLHEIARVAAQVAKHYEETNQ